MIVPYLKILRKRNFLFLWIGQIVSQFGDRLTQMALIGLVYRLKPGSSIGLAKMLSLAIIPVFLISPIAGVYIDRWDKRRTMFLSDFFRGLFILSIPFISSTNDTIIFIYSLVFLSFCVGRFFIPAKMAIIPSLVSKEEVFLGNSLVSITAMIAAMLGFGVGGIIVEKWGVETAFFLDAITFFISALFIIFMNIKERAVFTPKDILSLGKDAIFNVRNSFIFEVKAGVKYIFESSQTRYAAKVFFILFASIGSL
ncbi:MAG: MFS transporter, partial [Candidatus Omnitrophota bacterium]